MAPGRADYYLTAVARGGERVEGYYLARGEEPGRWLGTGAEQLGLSGEVTAGQLRPVLDARHPDTGQQLARHPARKVPGFDHTLRAPLLWALSDRDTAAEVVAAHDAAVDVAIGYLQRAAGFTRRGAGGAETLKVDGFVAAAFRHRTSRADDPLLHTHVLVANLARTTDDGVWRTLDSRRLFAHAKTAGVLYQAQLRHELTRRLGIAWQPVVNGVADIDGVDRQLIDTFSQRRTAIVHHMAARRESSAAAADRHARDPAGQVRAPVRGRASRRLGTPCCGGWGAARLAPPTGRPRGVGSAGPCPAVERAGRGGGADGVVVDVRTAGGVAAARRPAACRRTGRLGRAGRRRDPEPRHRPARHARSDPRAAERRGRDPPCDGRIVAVDADEARYTTRGLLLTEHRAINQAIARHADRLAVADQAALHSAVGRRNLTGEQQTMVVRLTSSGAGVEVVIGKAGTGKTYALEAAREVWEASGVRVTGVALAARAALEPETSAGIASTTLARLLRQLDDQRHGSPLPPGSVLVVDEAGMIGTRQLARLLGHTQAQSVKVVLVGDPRQLPEIDAGGLFRALGTRLAAVELTDNRRQRLPWEQAALDELRHGDPDVALAGYQAHGRIRTAETAEAVRQRLVDDWWTTASTDLAGSIMIGLRHTDVADLNHRARTRMSAAGRLTGPPLQIGEDEFRAGDRIVCLRNNRTLGVVNGTRATIVRIHPSARTVEAVDDRGRPLTLPGGYLDAGHVTHGYAITGHKAQGLTLDHTYTLGTETLYREWGYVAMSRGRLTNQLYHGPAADHEETLHHLTHIEDRDDVASLTSRLRRTRAETPISPQLADLAAAWQQLTAQLDTIDLPRQQTLLNQRDRLEQSRVTLGGTLEQLERRLGQEQGGFLRFGRRRAIGDLEAERESATVQLADLTDRLASVQAAMAGLPDRRELGELFDRLEGLDAQLRREADVRVRAYRSDLPPYLTAALGPPPADGRSRERWERTATAIEQHRLRWDITDPTDALGSATANRRMRQSRAAISDEIRRTVDELRHDRVSRRGFRHAR
jgi:conjugative relaxase-like TrwC/TraI family protein